MASTVDETGASTAGTEGTGTGTGTAQGSTASGADSSAASTVDGYEPLVKRLPVIFVAVGLVITVVALSVVAFFIVSGGDDEITLPPLPHPGPKPKREPPTIPRDFLVCTFNGEGPSIEHFVPPRTLCDIIFFDSVHKVVRKEVQATFNTSLQGFTYWTHQQRGGQFGFSYSVETGELRDKILGDKLGQDIKILHQNGFKHTAVINIHRESASKGNDDFKVAIRTLRTAFKVVSELEPSLDIYTVLGADIKDASALRDLLSEMKEVFVPSMLISITHTSHEDRALKDCRIVPPTWLSDPNGEVSYGHSLTSSCQLLQEVAKANVNISLAVSFTLSGHMYKPQGNKPEDFKLFKPCEDFNGSYYVKPYEFCKPNIFGDLERSERYMFTFNTSAQRTLTFESKETIQNKVCEARSTCQGVTFGVAAYDIEYDNQPPHPWCPEFGLIGPYGRVAVLKKMNEYLTQLSSAGAFSKKDCLNVEIV